MRVILIRRRLDDKFLACTSPSFSGGQPTWTTRPAEAVMFDTIAEAKVEVLWQLQHNRWLDDIRLVELNTDTMSIMPLTEVSRSSQKECCPTTGQHESKRRARESVWVVRDENCFVVCVCGNAKAAEMVRKVGVGYYVTKMEVEGE